MAIKKKVLERKIDNKEIYEYTLTNKEGMEVKISNYGGIILSIYTKDKNGRFDDIVLGYEDFNDYKNTSTYFGAIIGRYANRIAKGEIEVDGVKYELVRNNGNNHLHGGNKGFNSVVWNSEIICDENSEYLRLSYLSKDGEENYPGNLNITVSYKLNDKNELSIEYTAKTDKETIVNLTNHSYFNLGGHASGDILNHKVKIYGKNITATNEESIPTGEIRNITETPMDFTEFRVVGKDIDSNYDQIKFACGYDHNWIIDDYNGELKKAAEVIDEESGRKLEAFTTKPGIQFYTGNFIDNNEIGKGGVVYGRRQGLCLETQYFPDSMHHEGFSNVFLKPEEEYKHKTVYKFSLI